MMGESSWLQRYAVRTAARVRLVCFPHAGANAGFFRPWAMRLPTDIELLAVELPGRRARIGEPPLTSITAIVDGVVAALEPLLDRRIAFFGHSMGALVAFEVARRLNERGLPLPSPLVLSGRHAPDLPSRTRNLHDLSDRELIEELAAMGGTSPDILREPELMELLLPSLRADLIAIETFHHRSSPPLPVPIVAVAGIDDAQAQPADLESWAPHTTMPLEVKQFPGGHFYLMDVSAMLDWLLPLLGCDIA